eukprot:TRINITY_DN2380_c0_g1_i2.p3 TRINITY_DN2380_c0_g1~~TRINITY_DN2380_c0_g1_i2.p3  ORF type:complete len:303 (+),score=42.15 TRINITY_DN2380_c0_g1_i2:2233-3141(+)
MDLTVFRQEEKRYKLHKAKPLEIDLVDVIDVTNPSATVRQVAHRRLPFDVPLERREADIFTFDGYDGCYLFSNFLTPNEQLELVKDTLCTFPQPPHETNLTNLGHKPSSGSLLYTKDLRWVTLGYHHNWDTRKYCEEKKSAIPAQLDHLAKIIFRLGQAVHPGHFPGVFKTEAAIINYYNIDNTLCGHIDDSEICLAKPIITASFGASCIFLIAKSRDVKPAAIFVRSGDVLAMAGPLRLAVHAVPRIIKGSSPDFLWRADQLPEELHLIAGIMQDRRVNVSMRQVLGPGQSLNDPKDDLIE